MFNDKKTANQMIRPAAVAGMFYPAHKDELRTMLEQLLAHATNNPEHDSSNAPPPKALIVPHAGYIYSGQAAANVYKQLQNTAHPISRVVLLGPAHRVGFRGIAGTSADFFSTPLGNIPIDQEAMQHAFQLEGVQAFDKAHAEEHSLEVQLPFLQTVLGEFSLVPFVVGDAPEELTAKLLETLWDGDETLIVISSDLSHFMDYASAREHDATTAANIETFHGEKIGPYDACGYAPLRGLLKVAKQKNMKIERVSLCNSGDTGGDKNRVVGYASYALH